MYDEPTGTPTSGPINRILSSRFSNGQGVQHVGADCGDADGCPGQYLGRLQPYSIYVPDKPTPPDGRGLTLLLHSLGGSFNQMHGTKNQAQFGDRGKGHIVITPESRGPDGWYYGLAGAEVFEVWADVARRYRLDPRKTAVTGYSMGGYGTYKFATQFPDLFAAAQPTVGPPGIGVAGASEVEGSGTNRDAPLGPPHPVHDLERRWRTSSSRTPASSSTARRSPTWASSTSSTRSSPPSTSRSRSTTSTARPPSSSARSRVEQNPAHVTYVRNPAMDFAKLGTKADGAYWVQGVKTAGDGLGTIDAFSKGLGRDDDEPGATQTSAGVLTGGLIPALAFERQFVEVDEGGGAQGRQARSSTPRTSRGSRST